MHPILFHIGSFAVHSYGVMLMIAFAIAIYRANWAASRLTPGPGVPEPADVMDVSVWTILAGIVGARALFIALDWKDYSGHPGTWLAIWEGGISFHGGLIAGLIVLILYARRRRVSLLKLTDVIAPSAMIGYAIGRIGCFLNGCCYGAPTSMPWGVKFFDEGHWTQPSHPTQIYASLISFVFFALLVQIEKRKSYDGQLFGWYLVLAATERFIMEIWRGGYTSTVVAFGLTDTQFWCLGILATGSVFLYLFRRRKSTPPAVSSSQPAGAVTP